VEVFSKEKLGHCEKQSCVHSSTRGREGFTDAGTEGITEGITKVPQFARAEWNYWEGSRFERWARSGMGLTHCACARSGFSPTPPRAIEACMKRVELSPQVWRY